MFTGVLAQQLPDPGHSRRHTQFSHLLRACDSRSEDHKTKSAAGVALVTTYRVLWTSGGGAGSVRLEHVVRAEPDVRISDPLPATIAPSPRRQLCRRVLVDEVPLRTGRLVLRAGQLSKDYPRVHRKRDGAAAEAGLP